MLSLFRDQTNHYRKLRHQERQYLKRDRTPSLLWLLRLAASASLSIISSACLASESAFGPSGELCAGPKEMDAPLNGKLLSAQTMGTTPVNIKVSASDPLHLKQREASDNFQLSRFASTRHDHGVLSAKVDSSILKGAVEKNDKPSPFLTGHIQTLPKGTEINLTFMHNINSEFTQKGDEIWVRVSSDVEGSHGKVMPGGWYMHGLVSECQGRKRLGRDGYVEIQFDKLVSPNGEFDSDFSATLSTKDSTITSVTKEVFTDSRYTAVGALGGALLSLQVTGLGGAIATHGISVGVGAGIGGGIGLFGALKRFGSVANLYPGDDMKMTISEPIELPVFKESTFVSSKPAPVLKNMKISVNRFKFFKDPYGDKHSKLLQVEMTIENRTKQDVSARQISVISDFDKQFLPLPNANLAAITHRIEPNSSEGITIVYEVDSDKHKYWLSLHDVTGQKELSRIPVN